MSTFASIAVLSKPTEIHPDWEFEMEGLKFAVHDGMVELNQEIHDFNQFYTSMENLFSLIDSIDSNRGRLDEAVYSLVNQNNELAEALGIYTPFSFATEEEKAQAGQEIKNTVENGSNDENKEPEKGFFAKAWDAIKRFFASIKNALVRIWGAITGSNKSTITKAKEISDAARTASPSLNQYIADKLKDLGKDVVSGKVRFVLLDDLVKIKNACASIAEACAKIPADPKKFIAWKGNTSGSVQKALNVDKYLVDAGYETTTEMQNGIKQVSHSLVRKSNSDKDALRECWMKPENRVTLLALSVDMSKACDKIRATVDNLTAASEKITKDPKAIEAMAIEMAKGSWKDKPHVKAKTASWFGKLRGNTQEVLDAQAASANAKIDADNATRKNKAIGAKREIIQASMLYEKELADYCKEILVIVRTLRADFEATIDYLFRIQKKFNLGKKTVENSRSEKERNESLMRDGQRYRDEKNAEATAALAKHNQEAEDKHQADVDTQANEPD